MCHDEKSRNFASLHARYGGLRLRQAVDVSLQALISSVHTRGFLVDVNGLATTTELVEAVTMLDELSGGTERPVVESSFMQRI